MSKTGEFENWGQNGVKDESGITYPDRVVLDASRLEPERVE